MRTEKNLSDGPTTSVQARREGITDIHETGRERLIGNGAK